MLLKMKMTVKFLRNGEEEGDPAKSWTHQVTVLEVKLCTHLSLLNQSLEYAALVSMIEMAKEQGNHFEMSRAGGWRIALFRNLLHKRLLTSL